MLKEILSIFFFVKILFHNILYYEINLKNIPFIKIIFCKNGKTIYIRAYVNALFLRGIFDFFFMLRKNVKYRFEHKSVYL
jgi:hypothetical protein